MVALGHQQAQMAKHVMFSRICQSITVQLAVGSAGLSLSSKPEPARDCLRLRLPHFPSSTSHSPRHARRPTSQVSRRASLISRSRLPTSTADGFLASNARSSAIDNLALAHLTARRPQLPVAARPLLLPASHPNAPSPKL